MTRKIKRFGGYTAISGIMQKQRCGLAYFLLVYLSENTPLLKVAVYVGVEAFAFPNLPWLVIYSVCMDIKSLEALI